MKRFTIHKPFLLLILCFLCLICLPAVATEQAFDNPLWDFNSSEDENHVRTTTLWAYKSSGAMVIPLQVYDNITQRYYAVTDVTLDLHRNSISSLTFETSPETGQTCVRRVDIIGCSGVTAITVPEGVDTVKFSDFPDLVSLKLSSTVTSAYGYAFAGNSSLKEFQWGGLKSVPRWAFYKSGLEEITVPEGTLLVDSAAFNECTELKSAYLPDTVETLGSDVFNGCTSLTDIHLPEGVTELGLRFFQNCSSLKEIHIPESVTRLDEWAFEGCSSLCHMNLPSHLSELNITVFGGCNSLFDEFTIPGTLEDASLLPTRVKKLVVEEGVKSMYGMWLTDTEEIVLPSSLEILPSVMVAKKATVPTATFIASSQDTLEELVLTSTESMGKALIGYTKLKSVTLQEGIPSLPENAFKDAKSLPSIQIPSTVTQIGPGAFEGCSSLTSIEIPEGVTNLDSAFRDCTSLKTVQLPDSLESMRSAFENCTSLGDVTVPAKVTDMNHAFCNSGVTASNIPVGVKDIECVFMGCTSLTSIILPEGLTLPEGPQGFDLFRDCTSLKSVPLPDSMTFLQIRMFQNSGLETVSVPEGCEKIPEKCFSGCTSLREVHLPDSLTRIDYEAFWDCTALKEIELPDNVGFNGGGDRTFPESGIVFVINDGTIAADCVITNYPYEPTETPTYRFFNPLTIIDGSTVQIAIGPSEEKWKAEAGYCVMTITAPDVQPASDGLYYSYMVVDSNNNVRLYGCVQKPSFDAEIEGGIMNGQPFTVYVGMAYNNWVISRDYSRQVLQEHFGRDSLLLDPVSWRADEGISYTDGFPVFDEESFDLFLLPADLTAIETGAFEKAQLDGKCIVCPAYLETIGENAFLDAHPQQIFLPESVQEIAKGAFEGCSVHVFCFPGSYAERWARENGFLAIPLTPQDAD